VITLAVILVGLTAITNVASSSYYESEILEKTWTIIPMLILVSIGIPRIHLLCSLDSVYFEPIRTIKITRNQWNWQRESGLYEEADHLLDRDDVDNVGSYENPLCLLRGFSRFLVARTDVLHSLGIPRVGIKLDSIPGRLNSLITEVSVIGRFQGSCYELCGSGHRVMPITIVII